MSCPPLLQIHLLHRQAQSLTTPQQPLQYLRRQSRLHTVLNQLVVLAQLVPAVCHDALEALRAHNADRPVDREDDVLAVGVAERLGWVHEARDDRGDGGVGDVAAVQAGGVEAAAGVLRRADEVLLAGVLERRGVR